MIRSLKSIIKPLVPLSVLRGYQNIKLLRKFSSLPDLVGIENANVCNARCITCPYSHAKRKQGFMDIKLYNKIIDECEKLKISKLAIGFFGEPILDPFLVQRIDYAKKKSIKTVSTFSNAQCLDEELSRKILESDLDKITLSVDAAQKSTFEQVNKGLSFEAVTSNIERFVELKKILGNKKLQVVICMTVIQENRQDIDAFLKKYKSLLKDDGEVVLIKAHNWGGKHNINDAYERKNRIACHRPFGQMIILADGRVVLCCCDYSASVIVGDINKQSIPEIWNGKVLKKIRQEHLKRRFDRIGLCSECIENYADIKLKNNHD